MALECDGCGNKHAHRIRIYEDRTCICDACGMGANTPVYDVYWDGKPEHGLADDPATGKPRVFTSKAEKAMYLREKGLVEMGDRVKGAHLGVAGRRQKPDSRETVREALNEVRSWGREYRHQKFLEVIKNRGRFHVER